MKCFEVLSEHNKLENVNRQIGNTMPILTNLRCFMQEK